MKQGEVPTQETNLCSEIQAFDKFVEFKLDQSCMKGSKR